MFKDLTLFVIRYHFDQQIVRYIDQGTSEITGTDRAEGIIRVLAPSKELALALLTRKDIEVKEIKEERINFIVTSNFVSPVSITKKVEK